VRNASGIYAQERSNNLQKVKEFQDAEFQVVGHKKDASGNVLWVCSVGAGKTFTVKPKASDDISRDVNAGRIAASTLVGRAYTVKYQELTDAGIPRFPVGLGFKDVRDIQKEAQRKPSPMPASPKGSPKGATAMPPRGSPKGATAMPEVIDLVSDDEVIELDEDGNVVRPSKKIRIASPRRSPKRGASPRRAGGAGGSPKASPRRASPARGASPRRPSPVRGASPSRGTTSKARRDCVKQTSAKYLSRPSPPYPANECCGKHILGNDGNMYTSLKNKAGICQWKMGEF
jgi:hypothetical protein